MPARKIEPCCDCGDPRGHRKAGWPRPFRDLAGRCYECHRAFRRVARIARVEVPPCVLCGAEGGPIEPLTGTHGRLDGRCYRCLAEEVAHDTGVPDAERGAYLPGEAEIESEAAKIRGTWDAHRFCLGSSPAPYAARVYHAHLEEAESW